MAPIGALFAVAKNFRGQGTDFTIVCDTKSWKVHSFVLNLYSDVLACACDGKFKVQSSLKTGSRLNDTNRAQEAESRTLDLSVDGMASVTALVNYMYYFNYTVDGEEPEPYTMHVNMVLLADKYDIPHLLGLANHKLVALLTAKPLHATQDLIEAAKLAYEADIATEKFRTALVDATIRSSLAKSQQYSAIIRALPALAQEVALAMPAWQEKKSGSEVAKCAYCGKEHHRSPGEYEGTASCSTCGRSLHAYTRVPPPEDLLAIHDEYNYDDYDD